jgi:hypothetical protein
VEGDAVGVDGRLRLSPEGLFEEIKKYIDIEQYIIEKERI